MAQKKKASPKAKKGSAAPKGVNAAAGSPELQRLEQILQMMSRHQIAELEWEREGEWIKIRGQGAYVQAQAQPMSAPAPVISAAMHAVPASVAAAEPAGKPAGLAANQKQVTSPFVGTFYRAPAPNAEPYVREGQMVKRGDVLCIIEAMKLMNEIEVEFAGRIVSILVENGQPVEFGEPLFVIETA